MPASSPASPPGAERESAYAYLVLFILLAASIVSFIDRQVLGLLVEPIKRDLGLDDVQLSLVTGFSFALFYAAVGLLMGRLADRRSRRNLILLGIAIWVPATALAGFVETFAGLLLSRVLIAVGEAMLAPAAFSMLADYFRPQRLSFAMGLYSMGVHVGSALAFLIGGAVMAASADVATVSLGVLGALRPWQLTFVVVAAPGVLVFLLMLLVREPPRSELGSRSEEAVADAPLGPLLRRHGRIYLGLMAGFGVIAIVTYGYVIWLPAAFMRSWGWSTGEVGLTYGSLILTCGIGGVLAAGALADRLRAAGARSAALDLAIGGAALLCISCLVFAFTGNALIAWAAVAVTTFALGAPIALAPSVLLAATPNRARGQIISMTTLAITLIGLGLGPSMIAVTARSVLGDENQLRLALALVSSVAAGLGALLLWSTRAAFRAMLTPAAGVPAGAVIAKAC
jgi:MFS family permease